MRPFQACCLCFLQDFEEFHNSALTSLHPDTMCTIVRWSMGFAVAWLCSFSFLLPNIFLLQLWMLQITHILPGNDEDVPVLGKTKAKRGGCVLPAHKGCSRLCQSGTKQSTQERWGASNTLSHFMEGQFPCVQYLDSLDWTPACSRKLTPILMDSRQGSVITRTKIKKKRWWIFIWLTFCLRVLTQSPLSLPDMRALHSQCILAAYTTSPNNSQPSFTLLPRLSEQPSVDSPGCSHSWRIQKIARYKDSLWLPGGILEHPIFKIAVWCFFLCFVSVSKETSKNAVALQIHPQTRELLWMRHH